MSTEKVREEFEAWVVGFHIGCDLDMHAISVGPLAGTMVYTDWIVQSCWGAWQASRAALAVELPMPDPAIRYMDDTGKAESILSQFRAAIEAAGITVKE